MSAGDTGPAPAARLSVSGVEKRYGAIQALKGVDVAIAAGEIHAFCGHNGAGKSTLVKILAGIVQPEGGTIVLDGERVSFRNPQHAQQRGVALVDQDISLIDVLSVADNILLGLQHAPLLHRPRSSNSFVRDQLEKVGLRHLEPGTPVSRLSMGERQLVEIARALGRDAGVLILDEPTATLSESEAEHVFSALRPLAERGTSIIFVSHRLGEVLRLCDRVTVFRDGAVTGCADVDERLDRPTLVEMMVGHVRDDRIRLQPRPDESAHTLKIRGLVVPGRLHGVDLDVQPGQIIALAGQIGSGASECLRALAGLVPGARGEVLVDGTRLAPGSPIRAHRAGMLYLSNDRKSEGLFLERSVGHNLIVTRLQTMTRAGLVRRREASRAEHDLAEVVGLQDRRESGVASLSGGNQQKVFLGRCLQRPKAGVLLLDEPTRGVDVGGRADIHALIRGAAAAGNAVVFASTETGEILDLADIVATLCAGRLVSVRPREAVSLAQLVAEMTHPEEVIPA